VGALAKTVLSFVAYRLLLAIAANRARGGPRVLGRRRKLLCRQPRWTFGAGASARARLLYVAVHAR
jgi:hypothetical protein